MAQLKQGILSIDDLYEDVEMEIDENTVEIKIKKLGTVILDFNENGITFSVKVKKEVVATHRVTCSKLGIERIEINDNDGEE